MKDLQILFLIFVLIGASCDKKDSNPTSPSQPNNQNDAIVTGTLIELTNQSIDPAGGTIRVIKPGDPIDGLELTLPSGSFTQTQNFTISSAPVISHQLGQYFSPISPMIRIAYQGGYSDQPMTVKVPVKVPSGKFAMGFFYDRSTGEIEGLPLDDMGTDYVTISTMHFTSNSSLGKRFGTAYPTPQTDIVISAIDDSVLAAQNIIDSGFSPGTDDWEFINYGSYIARGGHCAGQSMTAMWYYETKRKTGSSSLYHAFDQLNDPSKPKVLWQDNPKGYRFASTIQIDTKWDSRIDNIRYQVNRADFTWKTFALSMLTTGKPQYVGIRKSTRPYSGHAMIAYKIDYPNGILYVADPNYPGNRHYATGVQSIRSITFQNHAFNPYLSGLNADAPGTNFNQIIFTGKSAYVDWTQIEKRWIEFQAGTIGNDRFPTYTLSADSAGGAELQNGFVYTADPLEVVCKSIACDKFLGGTDHLQKFYVFDQNGNQLAFADSISKGKASINLSPGANKLGFYICGAKDSTLSSYVDFKWITVNSLTLSVDPKSLIADLNKECTFTAAITGSGSLSLKYVWNFGDGTPESTQIGINTAKHTFSTEGAFSVIVKLYDNSTGKLLAAASSSVTVPSSFIQEITNTQYCEIMLAAGFTADHSYFTTLGGQGVNSDFEHSDPQVVWNGLSFTSNYAYKIPLTLGFDPDTTVVTGSMSGSISADGKTLSVLTASEYITYTGSPKSYRYNIILRDVPYYTKNIVNPWTGYYYYVKGDTCQNYVSSATLTANLYNPNTSKYELVNSTSVVYTAASYLEVGFLRK